MNQSKIVVLEQCVTQQKTFAVQKRKYKTEKKLSQLPITTKHQLAFGNIFQNNFEITGSFPSFGQNFLLEVRPKAWLGRSLITSQEFDQFSRFTRFTQLFIMYVVFGLSRSLAQRLLNFLDFTQLFIIYIVFGFRSKKLSRQNSYPYSHLICLDKLETQYRSL